MISNCPRCHESYRVPTESLPEDAYAKCPWCHETFPLQEALRQLPPLLKIIGADGREISGLGMAGKSLGAATGLSAMAYAANTAGMGSQSDMEEMELDEDLDGSVTFDTTGDFDAPSSSMRIEVGDDDEIDPEFTIQDARGTQSVAPMRVQPLPPLAGAPSRRKKKGSPLKTLIGIALGPLIAIPAAAGILLGLDYMGIKEAPNLGVWPMDGSYSWSSSSNNRTAATALPNIGEPNTSPKRSNPPTGRSLSEDLGTSDSQASDPAADALAEISTVPETMSVTDATDIDAPTPEVPLPEMTMPEVSAPETSVPDASEPEVTIPEVTIPEVTMPEISMPSIEETEPLLPATAPAKEPTMQEPPATVAYAPEMVAARDKATEMLNQLSALTPSDAQRKPVLVGTYIALASVGSLLETGNAAAGEEIIAKLKSDESLLNDVAGATPQWLKLSTAKRPNQGVVIVGELETSGDSASIRLANDELLSVADADASITSGKVIGLGKIIDGPDGQSVSLPLMEAL